MFVSCMWQRNSCANVFANPSKSLNYEITCKCYSFLLLQRKPLQSDRIFVFYCYRYIFFVDNRLNPGQVDTCLTLARLLVGWVAAAVNRIHNTIDWNFTVVFADVIELYLQHNPKTQRKSMLTPMMWCEWNYVVITHDEQIPFNVTRAKREKLRRIFFHSILKMSVFA